MEVIKYRKNNNKQEFIKEHKIKVKRGVYCEKDNQYQVDFEYCHFSTFNNHYYRFRNFGSGNRRYYLKFNWRENILFRYQQGLGWFQQKENILWLCNIIVLLLTIFSEKTIKIINEIFVFF